MLIDPKSALTWGNLIPARAQATSTVNVGPLDLTAANFKGTLAAVASCGPKTAGDANPTWDLRLMYSHDTNFSNAVNITGANIAQVTNANSAQVIQLDTRVSRRYVWAVSTVTGVNGIIPLSVTYAGTEEVQPAQ